MPKFPRDAPRDRVLRALAKLGFSVRRERGEVSLVRVNDDLSETTMTLPRHATLKGPTIQSALRQAGISRDEFLDAYNKS